MASQLQAAVANVNGEAIEELKGENGHVKFVESLRMSMERFSDFKSEMIMVDSCSGDGIEVWVTLEKQVMDALRSNSELLSFASVDPSPLSIA
ncbi:unnamed protein product [Lactuca saligna]|uniref:Uncharacterized protein n=1 Tax=Lactuca saligna TaxID=75948 RepID=A0AA35YA05_LACSI|nr:unnamed protein product [Lactuca saligna]